MNLAALLNYAKGHVALVGSACTLVAALWPGSPAAHDASIVLGALTALGVYAVPNKTKRQARAAAKAESSITVHVHADTSSFRAEINRLATDLAKVAHK